MGMRIISGILTGFGAVMLTTGAGIWFYAAGAQAHLSKVHLKESRSANATSSLVMLTHPRLNESRIVVRGATTSNLARGPAIVDQTGNFGAGNCVIAGHRDTHFRFLKDVTTGDDIYIEDGGRIYHYRVSSTSVIDPSDVSVLKPTRRPVLTLVTCYPFFYIGAAPKRFIVRAELIETGL